MYCQVMCHVMLIILSPSNSCHYQPQYAHFIIRLLCVIPAQQCVAQCRRFLDLPWHTQHCIIQFWCAEGATPADVYSLMKHVYDNNCLQHTVVCDWCKRFKEGRSSIEDLAHPGYPPHVIGSRNRCQSGSDGAV
jgi:hypothetical protein